MRGEKMTWLKRNVECWIFAMIGAFACYLDRLP
jgi:hypothetical protein